MLKNALLLLLVAGLIAFPLLWGKGHSFGGADDQAQEVIKEVAPHYQRWFEPLWEPPSGEIESLLFALQAAIGSGFVFYYLGYSKGRRQRS
ncbi:energy-coupling factor ABC transporter substrate-binding protein [Desulfothermobacter acidiphilus]|uniref:energy-coupling factor ABC transporter substrate-binding protein n=1 Tax=Desulfothermobacter acidiphilus TaxID=1938353 RepID=UPI003F8B969D